MRLLEHDDRRRLEGSVAQPTHSRRWAGVSRPASADTPRITRPAVGRRAARLVDEHVRPLLREQLAAPAAKQAKGDLVRHRRGRDEQRLLLAEQLRCAALSSFTIGSSRRCSSPTTAAAIAARMPCVGWVAVSERRSIMSSA